MQVVCYKVYLHTIIPNTFPLVAVEDRDLRSHMTELFLIRIFGDGGSPVTQKVSSILADMDAEILDIGHSVIHNNLSLGLLVHLPESDRSAPVKLERRLGSVAEKIIISPVNLDSYELWVQNQGAPRYVLTLLARRLKASHLSAVSDLIAGSDLKVDAIKRLSGRISRRSDFGSTKACVEFSIRGEPQKSFRENLLAVGNEFQIDVALQEDGIYRRHRRLIAFDMDSTLIATEVIDELADRFSVGEKVRAITAKAMAGELDFADSLRRRVELLEGMESIDLEQVASKIPLAEGAESLFKTLNHLGYKTAIISGGFTFFGNQLKEKLGIDYVFGNQLEIQEGKITGKLIGQIIGAEQKAEILENIAQKENISLKQTIAVGDGANDLPMLSVAGLGIAFKAKPLVRKVAKHSISNLGLDSLLYLMGIRDFEINKV